jgi:hypothetical protein
MLVACRLAGLSALEAHDEGINTPAQSEAVAHLISVKAMGLAPGTR